MFWFQRTLCKDFICLFAFILAAVQLQFFCQFIEHSCVCKGSGWLTAVLSNILILQVVSFGLSHAGTERQNIQSVVDRVWLD